MFWNNKVHENIKISIAKPDRDELQSEIIPQYVEKKQYD